MRPQISRDQRKRGQRKNKVKVEAASKEALKATLQNCGGGRGTGEEGNPASDVRSRTKKED